MFAYNALLFGLPKYQLDRLQKVRKAAARVIFRLALACSIVQSSVQIASFCLQALHNQSPSYINDLLFLKPAANYALRSSAKSLLVVPKVNCSTLGDRAFAHATAVLWNSLPLTIRTSSSLAIFKKQLKTFLFKKAFDLLEQF